jgi:hypothetical protein
MFARSGCRLLLQYTTSLPKESVIFLLLKLMSSLYMKYFSVTFSKGVLLIYDRTNLHDYLKRKRQF